MNFRFTEKEEQLRSQIREFVKENIPTGFHGHRFWDEQHQPSWDFGMETAQKLAAKRWLAINWPEEYGGMGASNWEKAIMTEEVGYWGIPGTSMGISGTRWVGPALIAFGTEEQKQKYVPLIAAGDPEGVWCTGYSEPDSGTDLASLQTLAERVGNEYIINGQKVWTSCAHHARWLWMICRTNRDVPKKHQGLSLFIVDMQAEGLKVNPLKTIVGGRVFNELFFNDVKVPAENLVGIENQGWKFLMQALSFERSGAVGIVGGIHRIFDELAEYAKETGQFDRAEIRRQLTELAIDIESLRMLGYEAVWKLENGNKLTYEPSRDKAFTDTFQEKLSRIGMDMMGAYSQVDVLTKDSKWTKIHGALEHLYYHSMGIAIAAGTTDTQKNLVGQFGLGLPRAY
jgi:alkylation response protein AidB-like acyl-CoA dehydrogenase